MCKMKPRDVMLWWQYFIKYHVNSQRFDLFYLQEVMIFICICKVAVNLTSPIASQSVRALEESVSDPAIFH